MKKTMTKTYTELLTYDTYKERYEYLKLDGNVCSQTFGSDRYLNQMFYNSPEWRVFRRDIIIRDDGCDMALEGHKIYGKIYVHHINPITATDIVNRSPKLFDPENVVCLSFETHNAITYDAVEPPQQKPTERHKNDTCPWRH